uniref:Ephrin-A1 n=1 Tax=Cairina moschata TaxID=8855 RepID=A0A8C3GHL4_CAIMO
MSLNISDKGFFFLWQGLEGQQQGPACQQPAAHVLSAMSSAGGGDTTAAAPCPSPPAQPSSPLAQTHACAHGTPGPPGVPPHRGDPGDLRATPVPPSCCPPDLPAQSGGGGCRPPTPSPPRPGVPVPSRGVGGRPRVAPSPRRPRRVVVVSRPRGPVRRGGAGGGGRGSGGAAFKDRERAGRAARRSAPAERMERLRVALGAPLWVPLLGLCWAAAAERHTVFWNSSNPKFLWSDYTVEVRLNDYLDIICPHYEEGSVAPHAMERYTLYLVDLEEYQACKARSKEQIRWECDKPSALHGPEKFSEKFQRFTPFTLGKEFKEGHSYYYISKPIHHHGETCLKLKVTVLGKGTQAPPAPASTQKGRIQADDAAAHVLRSVGQNSAMRASSPFTFISLLLPLLVPQGL